ncbi:hypothetical protein [Microbacterium timonense]|jgi:hypothetical protein|uniref:hypothetical protein n=1 Tax=Microbacterium timonense TaxID=2086576 RepID=UPI000D0F9F04|nr:hypothetical protein [Microbacterium timonense]
MFAVFAAEQQYHHDTLALQREHALLVSMRERSAVTRPHRITAARAAERPQRAGWPRPIGLRTQEECTAACAVA